MLCQDTPTQWQQCRAHTIGQCVPKCASSVRVRVRACLSTFYLHHVTSTDPSVSRGKRRCVHTLLPSSVRRPSVTPAGPLGPRVPAPANSFNHWLILQAGQAD